MFKTGNAFIDNCLTSASFLPLLPAFLIILKKMYLKEPMNFLMIVCLLNFLAGGIRQLDLLNANGQAVVNNIFALLEMIFMILLFRPGLSSQAKNAVNVFLIAFFSVMLTYFVLRGWGNCNVTIDTVAAFIIAVIIGLSLPPLIRNSHMYILQSPLIWIAGGTLFYFFTLILLEWVGGSCYLPVNRAPDTEKMILLAIAGLVRYLLYVGAILVA
jgi:hypothetical protein